MDIWYYLLTRLYEPKAESNYSNHPPRKITKARRVKSILFIIFNRNKTVLRELKRDKHFIIEKILRDNCKMNLRGKKNLDIFFGFCPDFATFQLLNHHNITSNWEIKTIRN